MKAIIEKLTRGIDMTPEEATRAMTAIMSGEATSAQIAAFAVALRMKGETAGEIASLASVMRLFSVKIPITSSKPIVDPVGTGGDNLKTFNVSTGAALVTAATGLAVVAKHGNRAATSKCGTADVLEASGVNLSASAATVARCIDEAGIGFLFAQISHPALKNAAAARREIGVKTVFNILGPLTNPAGAARQLIGVNSPKLCQLMAEALLSLGCERAMVVYGMCGLDEISNMGDTLIADLKDGKITTWTLNAQTDLGLPLATLADIASGENSVENAEILKKILEGKDSGPRRDMVAINAAATLLVAGVVSDLKEGLQIAYETLASGKPAQTLKKLAEVSSAGA